MTSTRANPGLPRRRARRKAAALLSALSFTCTLALATPAHATTVPLALWNVWTGKCMDVPGYDAPAYNGPVNQHDCNYTSSDNQLWYDLPTRTVTINGSSTQLYEFENAKGTCLDLPNYGAEPAGTHLQTFPCAGAADGASDNQEWYFGLWGYTSIGGTTTPVYIIQNYKSNGLCLDVQGWASNNTDLANDLPLTIYPCYDSSWANNGYDDHLWVLRAS